MRGLSILLAAAAPLSAHMMSMSAGDLAIAGAEGALRAPDAAL